MRIWGVSGVFWGSSSRGVYKGAGTFSSWLVWVSCSWAVFLCGGMETSNVSSTAVSSVSVEELLSVSVSPMFLIPTMSLVARALLCRGYVGRGGVVKGGLGIHVLSCVCGFRRDRFR